MPRHVVARLSDIPAGARKLVHVGGRDVVVLNINGQLFALSDKCPHKGRSLSRGKLTGVASSPEPGKCVYERSGEILRCPWHGWEFDARTGRSWCDPKRLRLLNYPVSVEQGAPLVEGPYVAETFPVTIDDTYVVIQTKWIRNVGRPAGPCWRVGIGSWHQHHNRVADDLAGCVVQVHERNNIQGEMPCPSARQPAAVCSKAVFPWPPCLLQARF